MAAHIQAPALELIELPQLDSVDLDHLLADEINIWRETFAWDYRPSADLLRRYIHIRSLTGCALRHNGQIIGYAYYVCEGKKALIGDFYVRSPFATPEIEMTLLEGVIRSVMRTPGIRRIESQLMLLQSPPGAVLPLPFRGNVMRYERLFMELDCERILNLPQATPNYRVRFVPWAERYQEEMAHLISAAYRGHVDSEINDQYRSIPGARQFLNNIIRFPGCGRFSPESSVLAIDVSSGKVCGMCLASQIGADAGHVTQLCVLPAVRHVRLGYELLRESVQRLRGAGCHTASLTVTGANVDAFRLYESIGFEVTASFPALVWDRS